MSRSCTILAILLVSTISSFQLGTASTGTADFFGPPYTPTSCNENKIDQSVLLAGVSKALYGNGVACGQMFTVTCLSGKEDGDAESCIGTKTVTVKVVDLCDPCSTDISLSFDAFKTIAKQDVGEINVSFESVPSYP